MSATAAARRRRVVAWTALAAALAVGLAAVALLPPMVAPVRAEVGALVAPGFADRVAGLALVKVTTAAETYQLVRGPNGWSEPERGGYKIASGRIDELVGAIAAMKYAAPMTRDEKKFDRIGLGDPLHGGAGALVEVGDGKGPPAFRMIVGYRDGRTYVRETDDLQAWAVSGAGDAMPPLQRGARWLDLDIVKIAAPEIREVEVRPVQGPAYRLLPKDETAAQFNLAPPYDQRRLTASFAPTLPGQALSKFSPTDVAEAASLKGAKPIALHTTRLRNGLEIMVQALKQSDHGWVSVSARAAQGAAPAVAAEASAINVRAAGWVFSLSANDWSSYATPLDAIVEAKGAEQRGLGPPP